MAAHQVPINCFHDFCSTRCTISLTRCNCICFKAKSILDYCTFSSQVYPSKKERATDASKTAIARGACHSISAPSHSMLPRLFSMVFSYISFSPSTQRLVLLDDWLHNNYLWIAKRMSALKNDGKLVMKVIITIKRWMMWWLTDITIFFAAVFRTILLQLLLDYHSIKVLLNHIMIECLTTNTWESREHKCTVYSIVNAQCSVLMILVIISLIYTYLYLP